MHPDRTEAPKGEAARLRSALVVVAAVERQIRMAACTSAGDPKLRDQMMMCAVWAGILQRALAEAGIDPAQAEAP